MPEGAAAGHHSGERAGAAALERREQAFDILAAGPGGLERVFAADLGDGAGEEAAFELAGKAGRIDAPFAALGGGAILCELLGGPVERRVGLPAGGGGAREAERLELRVLGEEGAHRGTIEAAVAIGGVIDRLDACLGDEVDELGLGPAEQRPGDGEVALAAQRADRGEAGDAGAALEAHQDGLGLIVRVVGGEQEADALRRRPAPERIVANPACFALHSGSAVGDGRGEDAVGAA